MRVQFEEVLGTMVTAHRDRAKVLALITKLANEHDGKVIVHSPEKSDTSYVSTNGGDSWNPVKGLGGARPADSSRIARHQPCLQNGSETLRLF